MNSRRPEATFTLGQRNVLLGRSLADDWQLHPTLALTSDRFSTSVVVPALEAWCEVPVGDTWVAAFRFGFRSRQPLVTELRIFPAEAESRAETDQPLGHWSGEVRGVRLSGTEIPAGGLTAGVLRRLRFGEGRRFLRQFLRSVQADRGDAIFGESGMLGLAGFQAPEAPPVSRTSRPGPAGRSDAFYAGVARDYVSAVDGGSLQPVRDLARRRRVTVVSARAWVHRARARGMLTGEHGPGRFGGQLTPKATQLLTRLASPRNARRAVEARASAKRHQTKGERNGKGKER